MKNVKTFSKPAALITGASRRIGRAIALALAENGYDIVVHYHTSKKEAYDLCREIERKNRKARPIRADLRKPHEVHTLIDRSQKQYGPLSVLVNNASIFPSVSFDEMTLSDFKLNMLINAWAPLCLSRNFARKTKSGSIVNILDARRVGNDRRHAAYSLSKSALEAATTLCAAQFAPRIRVNGVAPGLILPPPGKDVSYLEKLKDRVPLRAYGDPQNIADAVVFLVKNPYITGEILHVDGGRHSLG